MSVYYQPVEDFLHNSEKPGNAKWCEGDNHCVKVQCAYYDAAQVEPGKPYDPSRTEAIYPEATSCQGPVRDWIDAQVLSQDMRSDGFDNIFYKKGILTARPDGYFYNSVDDFVHADRAMPGTYKHCFYDGECIKAECVNYDAPAVVTGQRYSASVPSTNKGDCRSMFSVAQTTELTGLENISMTDDGVMELHDVGPIHGGFAPHPGMQNNEPKTCGWHKMQRSFNQTEWVRNEGFEHRPIFVRKKDSDQYGWYWHTHGREYPPLSTEFTDTCSKDIRDECNYKALIFWCKPGNSGAYDRQEYGDANSKELMLGRDVLKVENSENWKPWLCPWCK